MPVRPCFVTTLLAAGILVPLLAPTPAAASDETITVTAGPNSGAAAEALTQQDPGASEPSSIVGRATLDRAVAPTGNYDDAIRLTPSVIDVAPNGPGLGEAQTLSIRGFQDGQYNVTFDSIPFADSDDFTHHSSAYFVLRDLGSVTVDRGPGDATTVGDATFGGTVALRSIGPAASGSVSPTAAGGSFGTVAGGVLLNSGAGALPGGGAVLLDAETARSDGALDDAAQRRGTLFGKAALELGPNWTLTLLSNLSRTVQNEPPGATLAQIAASGPSAALNRNPASQAFEGYNSSVYHTDLSYARLSRTTSGITLSDTLYTYGLDRHFEQGLDPNGSTPNGTARSLDDVPGQYGRNGLRAWGDIVRAGHSLPADLTGEAGLWIERQANARSLVETDATLGVPNPALAPVKGVAGSAATDRQQDENLLTVQPYAQLDWHGSPWLTLSAGVKGAWFRRDVDAAVMEGTRRPERFSASVGAALPSVTARLRLRPQWDAYIQAARGFLAPPLQDYDVSQPGRAAVVPETTWNFQLGTAWRSHALLLSADLYDIVLDHAVGVRTVAGESLDYDSGRVTYRGVEAEGTWTMGLGLSLYGSGSLNQAHQSGGLDDVSGPAPDTPQATISAGLLLRRGALDASAIDRWVGGLYGDTGGTQWIAPYNQLDLSTGYTLLPRAASPIQLRAQAFNLLGSRRIDGLAGYTLGGTPLYWTQAGRSFFLAATTRF